MPAERVGQGEVGGVQFWAQVALLLLGLAVESPWSALGGPCLSSCATNGLRNQSSGHVGPPFLAVRPFLLLCKGDHWSRAVTIASSFDSGCGLSLECV